MTALIIIGIFLILITAILFLPVDVALKLGPEFSFKIKFAGIKIYNSENKTASKENLKAQDTTKSKKSAGIFKTLKNKYGFFGAVKSLINFAGNIISHIKQFLKHIKLKKIVLKICVSGDDAAQTAIEYGEICAAVYPTLAGLEAVANAEYKKIDILSNFQSQEAVFKFSCIIRLRIFFVILIMFKIYPEYKKFTARIEDNE